MDDYTTKISRETMKRAMTPSGGYPAPIERNVTRVGTGQITVNSIPQQLSYADKYKVATKLTNLGTNDVFWGTNFGVTPVNGDLLPGGRGNWVAIPGAVVIFVVCASGVTQAISWAEAFDDDEG